MNSKILYFVLALVVAELIIILITVAIHSLLKKKKSPSNCSPVADPAKTKTQESHSAKPQNDFPFWEIEIRRTSETLLSRNTNALSDVENIKLLALNLRLQMLQLEQMIARTDADKRNINAIEVNINEMLKKMRIFHALESLKIKTTSSDEQETKQLIEKQNQTIQVLKKYTHELLEKILKQNQEFMSSQQGPDDFAKLSNAHNDFVSKSDSLMKKIDHLESNNKELTQCVAILEDENQFLRDQIAALLKIPDKK